MVKDIKYVEDFKQKALQWASSFDAFCYLDSNNFADQYSKFDLLLAVGVKDELFTKVGSAFKDLERFRIKHPGWVTGFFSYDLKNGIENLVSENPDQLQFPDLYFFAPKHLILIRDGDVEITSDDEQQVIDQIKSQTIQQADAFFNVQLSS